MHKIQINEGWQFNKIPDGNIRDLSGLTGDSKVVYSDVISSESFVTVTLPHTWYRDDDPYRGLVLYQ